MSRPDSVVVDAEQGGQSQELAAPPYQLTAEEVLQQLGSDAECGLTESQAGERRLRYGSNLLDETGGEPLLKLFLHQFRDLLILVLLVAAALAWYLGDIRGATVLVAIILINAGIGLYQEFHAEQLLERLKSMIRSKARVVRDGETREIEAEELVLGDVVLLEEGDAVPADLRLLDSLELATNDFMLTGESLPQEKDAEARPGKEVAQTSY